MRLLRLINPKVPAIVEKDLVERDRNIIIINWVSKLLEQQVKKVGRCTAHLIYLFPI